jgi:hypothetical protein
MIPVRKLLQMHNNQDVSRLLAGSHPVPCG